MGNSLTKGAVSCQRFGKYLVKSNVAFLFLLWYMVLLGYDYINKTNYADFEITSGVKFGGVIAIIGFLGIIGSILFSIIRCTKTYNILLRNKSNKYFLNSGLKAGLLWVTPIVNCYTKYRILKDLYTNLTDNKINSKSGIRIRYIFFILNIVFIFLILLNGVLGFNILPYPGGYNIIFAFLFLTISIVNFNEIVGNIGKYLVSPNEGKDNTKKDNTKKDNAVVNEIKDKNTVAEKKDKKPIKEKESFNYKWIIVLICFLLLIFVCTFLIKSCSNNDLQKGDIKDIEINNKGVNLDLPKINNDNTISSNYDISDGGKRLSNTSYDLVSLSYPSYFQVDTGYYEYLDQDNTLEIRKFSLDEYIDRVTREGHGINRDDEAELEKKLKIERVEYENIVNAFLKSEDGDFSGRVTAGRGILLGYKKINISGYPGLLVNYYDYHESLETLRTEFILFINDEVYDFLFQYNFGNTESYVKRVNDCNSKPPYQREKDCDKIINGVTYAEHFFEYKRDSLKNTMAECYEENYNTIMQVINSIKVKG